MIFNQHFNYKGKHAFLGASQYSWLNYTEDHLREVYARSQAAAKGTELHDLAARCIALKQKLPNTRKTINQYVNDAIGYRMKPEQILYYSDNCFGTADAISFDGKLLRIHDLKTGETPAKMDQLEIYAAIFCLEYDIEPEDVNIELRIYQSDEVSKLKPESDDIRFIMNKIILFDNIINEAIRKDIEE